MPTIQLGRKLIRYMQSKNWRVKKYNIVYLEDVNIDTWEPVKPQLDVWDDARVIVTNEGEVLLNNQATCEPGLEYTLEPLNSGGAFRIQSDTQFLDAWGLGPHKKQSPCLIQIRSVTGFRDFNKDGIRIGDKLSTGMFGINQHTTGNSSAAPPPNKVGRHSAGCLVGRYASTHYQKFMPLVKTFGWSTFDTAIVPGDKFSQFQ